MVSTAIVQLMRTPEELSLVQRLGYPAYLLSIIGTWKLAGVAAILLPGFARLKEWAYAGFFFVMSGAVISHLICADGGKELFGSVLLLVLTILSWYFRPSNRKLSAIASTHKA
jgi:hypothetical protein